MKQQLILPCIPIGATQINNRVGVFREDVRCTYFLGGYPIYSHNVDDNRMFRVVTSQLIETGSCRQIEILRTFGVSKSSVLRSVNKLRKEGVEGFFKPRAVRVGGTVLTPDVLKQAQKLLDEEFSRREIATQLGVKSDTLRKAITSGRLHEPKRKGPASTKSSRDVIDIEAANGLGTACTRVADRVAACFGMDNGATIHFESCLDVPKGGALCALPALLSNGLLRGVSEFLGPVGGYYQMIHILLLLAFMAVCRIKTVEQLRGHAPGEFGKLLGLDRVPEVRCLRNKLSQLSRDDAAQQWSLHLSRHWLEADHAAAGTLYVDGHVRVYHGGQTKLPRKFVSRERLCLRGVCDFWVNDATGNPFFVVEKVINPGMIQTLEDDIVPRLLLDIPGQPSQETFSEKPYLSRFNLIFDREGYSPAFFKKMWENHRIACITYHKFPKDQWPLEWFEEQKVIMPRGETITMRLAEMGSRIGSGKDTIWVREVRKLTDSCHQTSLVSTAYGLPHKDLAARMFSRWCQENFFAYMMHHFAIDLLAEYSTEDLAADVTVVNPAWRTLNKTKISLQSKLRYRQARFAEMTIHPKEEENTKRYRHWLKKKGDLLEEIQHLEHELQTIKADMKETANHIPWEKLEKNDQFQQLAPGRKHLLDTIKMIAYRAETSMAGLMTEPAINTSAARRLLQDLFSTEADILPDKENNILRIKVHGASRPAANKSIQSLFDHLNEAEMQYPGTDMQLVYELAAVNRGEQSEFGVTPTSQG